MLSIALTLALALGAAQNCPVGDAVPVFEDMPKIDVHAHVFDDIPEFIEMLRRNDMRVVNVCTYANRAELFVPAEQRAEMLYQKYRPTVQFCSTFDPTHTDAPDYAEKSIAWLDKSFEAGAIMAKIWKEIGMQLKTPTGAYLMPDDPVFDPIYNHLAKRGKPLMAHIADPIEAWEPLNPGNAHYGYFSKNPEWYVYGRKDFPSHEEIMASRDNIMAKHPDLVVIGAHLASMEHNLKGLALRLDHFSNFYVDLSARTYVLRMKPAKQVREFIMKYPDRILYATDAGKYTPEGPSDEDRVAFAKGMEDAYRADFRYFAEKGKQKIGNGEVECLGLPREVVEKIFYKNAQRLLPALAE